MHIVYLSREFPPEQPTAGIGSYVEAVSTLMADRGHRVTVVCGTQATSSRTTTQDGGRKIVRIPWNSQSRLPLLSHLRYLLRTARAISDIDKAEKIDLLEVPEYLAQALFLPIVRPKFTVSIRLHGGQEIALAQGRIPLSPFYWLIFLLELVAINFSARHLSAPSQHMLRVGSKKLWRKGNITLFKNPARHPVVPRARAPEPILLYVGRLEKKKGVHHIAEILPDFFSKNEKARAHFVGRDMPYDSSRTMVEFIKDCVGPDHERRVVFHGALTHEGVMEVMNRARLLVMPSFYEAFGLVALEAMSIGLPVVAYPGTAVAEIVKHDHTGFVVAERSVAALRAAVLQLFVDDARLAQYRTASLDRYERQFSADILSSEIETAYFSAARLMQPRPEPSSR